MQDIESLFLEVTKAIDEQDISSAKRMLEDLLIIDPGYGRAHNFLGWIYETKIKDFARAKRHYELAIKFCKHTYPIVYVNYAYLLIEYGFLNEAEDIISEGLEVPGADKATLFYQRGKIAESFNQYPEALRIYKHAQKLNFNKDFHRMLNSEIERVSEKMNFWDKLRIKLNF